MYICAWRMSQLILYFSFWVVSMCLFDLKQRKCIPYVLFISVLTLAFIWQESMAVSPAQRSVFGERNLNSLNPNEGEVVKVTVSSLQPGRRLSVSRSRWKGPPNWCAQDPFVVMTVSKRQNFQGRCRTRICSFGVFSKTGNGPTVREDAAAGVSVMENNLCLYWRSISGGV